MSAEPANAGASSDEHPKPAPDLPATIASYRRPRCAHHVEAHPTGKRLLILVVHRVRRRLRRHRHQPAVRHQGVLQADYGLARHERQRLRRPVADRLVADPHRRVKYVGFILRADNRGEGGVFALLALRAAERRRRRTDALAHRPDHARPVRRRVPVRRRHHHAGDLGARRRRGTAGRRARR